MSPQPVRRAASKALTISILMEPARGDMPLYAQLYRQLREHMLSGSLAPGSLLPSARILAADLHVSRNTVEAAISQLRAEGFVTRHVGAGTVVTDMREVAPFLGGKRDTRHSSAQDFAHAVRSRREPVRQPTQSAPAATKPAVAWSGKDVLSDRGRLLSAGGRVEIESDDRSGLCMTDVSRFPTRAWERTLARVARERGMELLRSGDLQGDVALREAISVHARLTRGLRCAANQVLILNSTQQALDLASRMLLAEGDTVLVEEPGYRSARATFAACGQRVCGIPVDRHGLQPEWLSHHNDARMLYLTPSHHFPLGVTLPLPRRLATLAWARDTGSWIIEDDYDSEFRYDGRPIAAMQGLDRADRVLYVGTFNKVLFPGVRVAYLVVPTALVDSFVSARRLIDGGAPTLVQAALAEFLASGHFAAHLRRSRKFYETQRNLLVDSLREKCGNAVTIGASETGLHLVAHLPPGSDDERHANAGAGNGLGVAPLSHYFAESRDATTVPRGLLFSFGGASGDAIRAGVTSIAASLRG